MDDEVLYTAALAGTLKLSAEGDWLHEGRPIAHPRVKEYLHRHIEWHSQAGEYRLRFGKGAATFTCEDTAYFVTALHEHPPLVVITLSDGSEETLDCNSLTIGTEDQMYCTVKAGHRARFLRGAYQSLVAHAVSDSELLLGDKIVTIHRASS